MMCVSPDELGGKQLGDRGEWGKECRFAPLPHFYVYPMLTPDQGLR